MDHSASILFQNYIEKKGIPPDRSSFQFPHISSSRNDKRRSKIIVSSLNSTSSSTAISFIELWGVLLATKHEANRQPCLNHFKFYITVILYITHTILKLFWDLETPRTLCLLVWLSNGQEHNFFMSLPIWSCKFQGGPCRIGCIPMQNGSINIWWIQQIRNIRIIWSPGTSRCCQASLRWCRHKVPRPWNCMHNIHDRENMTLWIIVITLIFILGQTLQGSKSPRSRCDANSRARPYWDTAFKATS